MKCLNFFFVKNFGKKPGKGSNGLIDIFLLNGYGCFDSQFSGFYEFSSR